MQDSSWKFKEEVAETAISLFKRDGYNNVTVNEICKACGISRSVFYSVFNGKRSILEYMVQKPQHNDDASFMKFAHADNDFERIWQLFDRFIAIAYDFGPELTSTLFIMQFESPEGIRAAIHALDDLFATLANNCAKAGIIDTEEPPDLLSRIATDLVCHELYVWCSQRATSHCTRVRGSMPRSPTTSSRNTACRPSSATRCELCHRNRCLIFAELGGGFFDILSYLLYRVYTQCIYTQGGSSCCTKVIILKNRLLCTRRKRCARPRGLPRRRMGRTRCTRSS